METQKPKPGINFTLSEETGNIVEGIHLETFYAYFKQRCDKYGWINLEIIPLANPIKEYTHQFHIVGKPRKKAA